MDCLYMLDFIIINYMYCPYPILFVWWLSYSLPVWSIVWIVNVMICCDGMLITILIILNVIVQSQVVTECSVLMPSSPLLCISFHMCIIQLMSWIVCFFSLVAACSKVFVCILNHYCRPYGHRIVIWVSSFILWNNAQG